MMCWSSPVVAVAERAVAVGAAVAVFHIIQPLAWGRLQYR